MNTPVFDALMRYNKMNNSRFHMPGHKGKDILFGGVGRELVALDVTELEETDNLAAPENIFIEAQKLAAAACGTGETLFLTGGATLGNLAMIYALCFGKKVIVDRFCHLSVFNALAVSEAVPLYAENEMADSCGVLGAVSAESVKKLAKENPDAACVFVTSPNSFGICAKLREIADVCREFGMLLLVDEAHGAHFTFSGRLPETAAQCGADASVQSFHKTLPALTQAAVLHINNSALSEKLKTAVELFQSSSPSYLLTASLDFARAYMEENKGKLEALIDAVAEYSPSNILKIRGADPLKLIIKCDGIKSEKILRTHGFVPEMYGRGYIVCIITVADEVSEVHRLLLLAERLPQSTAELSFCCTHETSATPAQALHGAGEHVSLETAVGRTAKKPVFLYPPGVPIIAPGHIVTHEVTDYIKKASDSGDCFCGCEKMKICVLK